MSDSMVPIAIIYSRSEAMVVASLPEARGILCHIVGNNHAAVSFYQMALGGFRLTVPKFQHFEASEIIAEAPGFNADVFSYGLQKAVIKFLVLYISLFAVPLLAALVFLGEVKKVELIGLPLMVLSVPVNPQGNSEYILSTEND